MKKAPMDMDEHELCRLKTGMKEVGDHCILPDGYTVSISTQKLGEAPTQKVTIDRTAFNKLIRWYITPKKI